MRSFNLGRIVAAAATAFALSISLSATAFAHGGGMGGAHLGNTLGHTGSTNLIVNNGGKLTHLDRDGRRFRRLRFIYVDGGPVCFYKWTALGRVRICPDYDY